ncbi:MAG: RNA recognition motif domain-containing protein [Spirosomataceae bacterium]
MNIFVAKLNYDTQEDTLRDAFEEFGTVDSAKIVMDKFTGRSKGFGFVEMPNDDEAQNAINALNDTDFDGRTIVVKVAEPREGGERRERRPGGFGGGGDRRSSGGYGERRDRY